MDELQKQLTAARALNTAAAPAAPTSDLVREAKLEAGKILADARLYAESAERELKQQAETQKTAWRRMPAVLRRASCWCGSVWPAWTSA